MALSTSCPACGSVLSLNARACPSCGWLVNAYELDRHRADLTSRNQQQQFENQISSLIGGAHNAMVAGGVSPVISVLILGGVILLLMFLGWSVVSSPYTSTAPSPEGQVDNPTSASRHEEIFNPFAKKTWTYLDNAKLTVEPQEANLMDGELDRMGKEQRAKPEDCEVVRIGPFQWIELSDQYLRDRTVTTYSDGSEQAKIEGPRDATVEYFDKMRNAGWVMIRREQDELYMRRDATLVGPVELRTRTELWARRKGEAQDE